jgi:hypothetical protein
MMGTPGRGERDRKVIPVRRNEREILISKGNSPQAADIQNVSAAPVFMTFREYCRIYRKRPSRPIADTCRFLESRGYRFLVHFGLDNAVELAGAEIIEDANVTP